MGAALLSYLLSGTVAAPFIAACFIMLLPVRMRGAMRGIALVGAVTSLVLAAWIALNYDLDAGGFQMLETYPVAPSIGIHLKLAIDGWGVSLFLLTGLIIVAGVLASWKLEDRIKEYFVFLLVLVAGVYGVFVSQDLFIFFLFYEIAVLPMYLLIGIWGSSDGVAKAGPFKFIWKMFDIGGREYAAMKLTLMLLGGSALILAVMFALYTSAGANTFDMQVLEAATYPRWLQMWAFPFLWFGFGSLAGVFPFHTWSPDGHAAAPTAVSMLHAGVLMKLGAFGIMRVGMVLLPEGTEFWAPVVGFVACINIIYGALSAMSQKDLKYIIAYSSVSHMGVVMLGAATMTTLGWNGAIYQMFAHGIMTGLFFALVGLVYGRTHTRLIARMGGLAKIMPGIAVCFTLAGLSSLGMPGTAGFVAELLVFLGAWQGDYPWWAIAGIVGALFTGIYVLRAVRAVFWGAGPPEEFAKLPDAQRSEWGALIILGVSLILFGWWPSLILDFIDKATPVFLQAATHVPQIAQVGGAL
jgi:NADH-quinone oxidoreductase subunit M